MPQTMIDEIRRTEAQAEEMKSQAAVQAREMIRAAEEEMHAYREEQLMHVRAEARKTVEIAEAASLSRIEDDRKADRQAQDALRQQARGQIDAAVRLVVERIVK